MANMFVCPKCGHVHECGDRQPLPPSKPPTPANLQSKSTDLAKHLLNMLPADGEDEWERKLNDWQRDFLTSVRKQFELKGTLSEKQLNVLQRMYEDLG